MQRTHYRKIPARKGKKGSALLFIMAFLSFLVVLAGSVGLITVSNLEQSTTKFEQKRARYAAIAGLQLSLLEFRSDPMWPSGSMGLAPPEPSVALPNHPGLEYRIQVLNNVDEAADRIPAVKAPDGSWVPGMSVWVESTGAVKGSDVEYAVVALVSRARPKFNEAAYGYGDIELKGKTLVDGYDSSTGPYAESFDAGDSSTWSQDGSVGSDTGITIGANSVVDGDASVSPAGASGGTPNIASAGTLTGSELIAERAKLDIDFRPPSHLTHSTTDVSAPSGGSVSLLPGSYRTIDLQPGSTLQLAPGTYYVSEDFLADGAHIVSSGTESDPVVIYVGQSMELTNGSVVNSGAAGNPKTLELYFTDEDTSGGSPSSTLVMRGDSHLSAVAAGRFLTATIEGSELYGALIAEGVITENTGAGLKPEEQPGLHYDTSLKNRPLSGMGTWTITSQRDSRRSVGTAVASADEPVKPPDYVAFDPAMAGGTTTTTGGSSSGGSSGGGSSSGGSSGGSGFSGSSSGGSSSSSAGSSSSSSSSSGGSGSSSSSGGSSSGGSTATTGTGGGGSGLTGSSGGSGLTGNGTGKGTGNGSSSSGGGTGSSGFGSSGGITTTDGGAI